MFRRIKAALKAFFKDPRHNHEFSDRDREKAELMKQIRKEMRDTSTLLEMKKEMLDLQKNIKGLSNDSPESQFFQRAMDLIAKKIEAKALGNQGTPSETGSNLRVLSDEEFMKLVVPKLEALPEEAKEEIRKQIKENVEQQKKEIIATCNVYKISPTDEQVNKVLEVLA